MVARTVSPLPAWQADPHVRRNSNNDGALASKNTMNACREMIRQWCVLLISVSGLFLVSCNQRSESPSALENEAAEVSASVLSQEEIEAGSGIPSCHIGMPIGDCVALFGEPDKIEILRNDVHADRLLSYYRFGIMIASKEGVVVQVYFWYLSDIYSRFPGSLQKGIGAHSTRDDLIASYGEPSGIEGLPAHSLEELNEIMPESKEFNEYLAGKTERILIYAAMGLDVSFFDNDLACIRVFVPKESRDVERRDAGVGASGDGPKHVNDRQ